MGRLDFLGKAYSYAKDFVSGKVLGKTNKSSKENYVQESLSYSARAENDDYFERGLGVACAFRAAKKSGKPEYGDIALSKFEALKSELSKDEAGALATDIWMNVEAYQATGDAKYARAAKEDADVLVEELIGDLRFARAGKKRLESKAEDQLLAASALLQLYELSNVENYRKKAEDLLDFFYKRHSDGKGKIAESMDVEAKGGTLRYVPAGGKLGTAYLNNLAAIAYMNAHRVTGKYGEEAKRFFGHSDKSLLLYSEANRSFKMKEYSRKYGELLKRELESPKRSASDTAGVIGEPAFNVEPDDPGLFREMLGVNFAAALGVGFVGTILPFYMSSVAGLGAISYGISLAATCAANVVTLPYIGKLADRAGKKAVLAAGLGAYALSILATPWSIENYATAGLFATQIARGVSGSTAGPIVSSLVTDAVPASRKTEALSKSATAFSLGYAGGSFSSGFVYEFMKNTGSEIGKLAPFIAAAALPAVMSVKLYSGYKKNQLRRKTLDSIFSETPAVRECEPAVESTIRACAV